MESPGLILFSAPFLFGINKTWLELEPQQETICFFFAWLVDSKGDPPKKKAPKKRRANSDKTEPHISMAASPRVWFAGGSRGSAGRAGLALGAPGLGQQGAEGGQHHRLELHQLDLHRHLAGRGENKKQATQKKLAVFFGRACGWIFWAGRKGEKTKNIDPPA